MLAVMHLCVFANILEVHVYYDDIIFLYRQHSRILNKESLGGNYQQVHKQPRPKPNYFLRIY